ncbi:hypothetical protein COCCADRAFT_36240 [Bipolaris zeicola 26-R-13]|uniref:FAD-binding domain-containing protein n=1 Tax=Cochliobolus carbonum (strain 26-R-13) TaxID=930089 RepID=W6YF15_COCC2|nr:uncharacterized protein COCCADRAFT_36240 [Bipolaris zeicola 26-R-13]EUC34084.1 hypothetical protein COCCADRAFT_36240 [Bipolaris zeicola 26-R-13]
MERLMRYPVAVIGGGPVGLSSSILLYLRNIPHVLFERHHGTSIHPKACGLNQRTGEIFRQMGVEQAIIAQGAPPDTCSKTASSPSRYVMLPQIRLEPILSRRAKQLNPSGVHYGAEVTDTVGKEDYVELQIKYRGSSRPSEIIQPSYLGIELHGEKDSVDMVTAHIRASIASQYPEPETFITWFINPDMGGSIPETEEWMFACSIRPDDPQKFDNNTMVTRVKKSINIPDLPVEILSVSHWFVNAISAERRYRSINGRTFLVGDAAHRIPPLSALGVNTSIQDANNMIWKLALALRIGKDTSAKDNRTAMQALFDKNHAGHAQMYAGVQRAQTILDTEFKAPGAEIGWFYPTADINNEGQDNYHDGQLNEDGKLNTAKYFPSTIPGHHFPHMWLRKAGHVVSSRDLLCLDKFVLFTADLACWSRVEHELIKVIPIGSKDLEGIDGKWSQFSGVDRSGAVLVRRDGIVAWRSKLAGEDNVNKLYAALTKILRI